MKLITPYLPPEAIQFVKAWQEGNKPAFVVAVEQNYSAECPNCGGIGVVFIRLMDAGPFKLPPASKKPITWFDGGEGNGPGWYVTNRTVEFPCPECQGGGVYREPVLEDVLYEDHTV